MNLSKYKKSSGFKANRVFTDRIEPRKIYWDAYDKLEDHTEIFKVLAFYGMGGIGKTKLQSYLFEEVEQKISHAKNKQIKQIFISLDAFEFDSPTDILIAIRKQLTVPAFLFDYALVTYWSAVGYTPIEIKKRFNSEDSIIWDILEEVGGLGGLKIPLKLIRSVSNKVMDKYNKSFSQYKEEMNEIDLSQPIDIFRKLPYYLGMSLFNAYEQDGIKYIIYFDAYETMLKKLKTKSVTESADEWIREFVAASEVGLFVIGSRDAMNWESYNPEWGKYIKNVDLDILPNEDADHFLQMVPIHDPDIRAEIVLSAKGIPLYLNLCVNIYEQKVAAGLLTKSEDFKMAEYEVIDRFLRHLSDEEAELVKTLSAIHFFDYQLFSYLLGKFHIGYPLTKYEQFIEKSFVLSIDAEYGINKIHDSIREYIFDGIANASGSPSQLSVSVIRSLFEYTDEQKSKYDYRLLERFFSQLVSLSTYIPQLNKNEVETLIEIGLYLSDNGYWNDVEEISKRATQHESLKDIFQFLRANCLLWKGKLIEGLEVINQVEISTNKLGRFETMAQYVKTHIIALSGRYDEAEVLYENLTNQITYHIESEKLYSKIFRQWGDLLYLRGKYKKSVLVLDELADTTSNIFEKAATIRTKGHVYRLNFLSNEAEQIYSSALSMFQEEQTDGYIGKSHTSLMETLCWSKPEEAIKLAPKAIEINEKQESKIELGRIYAALAIAHILYDKDITLASEYAELATQTQEETGFASGVLFSYIAKAMIAIAGKETQSILSAVMLVETKMDELKVYHCLKLPLYVYLNDQDKIKELETSLDWINFALSLERAKSIVEKLK
jgi:tetratricopeptide (TPR) repeat protein